MAKRDAREVTGVDGGALRRPSGKAGLRKGREERFEALRRGPLRAGLRIDKLRATLGETLTLHTVEAALDDWRAFPRGRPWPVADPAGSPHP